ncbi:SpoIIE family protein phosphatase [Streptomyces sp. NPDC002018]|uniref:SpoIIE family protein phosphatase n=1 Tax=Streptomyces sp. NPDC002018 TaxID=3364629 RepID=UPI00369E53B7
MHQSSGTGGHSWGGAFPALALVDAAGTIIGWSASAERLLGHSAAEVTGRPAADLLATGLLAACDSRGIAAWARQPSGTGYWSGPVDVRRRTGGRSGGHGSGTRRRSGDSSGRNAGVPAGGDPRGGDHVVLLVEASRIRGPKSQDIWLLSAVPLRPGTTPAALSGPALESVLETSPLAIRLWDRDLRCVWLNRAAQQFPGSAPGELLGRTVREIMPGFDAGAVEGAMRRVLRDGTPIVDQEFRRTERDGTEDRVESTAVFTLDAPDGQPLAVCSLALDISRSKARERLALLSEASTRVGSTLDVMVTAQELASLAVPRMADYITVDLDEAVLPSDMPLERLPPSGKRVPVFRRAGAESIHPDLREALWQRGQVVFVPPSSPFTRVQQSGSSHFEPVLDTSPGTWLDQDPDRARVIHDTGMHSLMITALRARGEILGIAVFVRTENLVPFTEDDLVLAEELAARAALSLDNARRYTRERTAAVALQRDLLPRRLDAGPAVELAYRYLPSAVQESVGGDWFDAVPLSGSRVALVVGDVVGHGVDAAATMGRLRIAVRTLAHMDLPPDRLLTHLDEVVVHLMEEDTGEDDAVLGPMTATCLYAVYDPATRRCSMSGAGHPPPAVIAPGGRAGFVPLPGGAPIGLGLGSFETVDLTLDTGTVLAFYTDGLVERRGADIDSGLDRLAAALTPGLAPLDDLCTTVIDALVGDGPAEDDIALLLARTHA